jgi:ubiquinone/menaquinone biosynthesis C-methylase UbiE
MMAGEYVHALRYQWLTPVYDLVVRALVRERTFKQALIEQACIEPGQVVIDLGCGTGTLAIAIKQQVPDATVIGIDGDDRILAVARRKAERAQLDVTFQHALAQALPLPDGQADRMLSTLFFHHLLREDKLRVACEALRVLKPEGQLHVADWGQASNFLMRLAFLPVQLLDGFDRTADNLRGELPRIMTRAGFHGAGENRRFVTCLGTLSLYSWHAGVPDD